MKKFNWGHGIFLVIVIFMVSFSIVLVRSFGKRYDHNLVTEDYYTKELAHQEVIDKRNAAVEANNIPDIQVTAESVTVRFDSMNLGGVGELYLYRPSGPDLDQRIPLDLSEELSFSIPNSKLSRGKYVVKLDWTKGEQAYYTEKSVFIP